MRARLINCSSACCCGELALPDAVRIENGEANLVVKIAGQDHVLVDDGDGAVEDDGRSGGAGCWAANVAWRGEEQQQRAEILQLDALKSNRRSFDSAWRKRAPGSAQDDSRSGAMTASWHEVRSGLEIDCASERLPQTEEEVDVRRLAQIGPQCVTGNRGLPAGWGCE